tara:strand:- start:6442 stop:6900 length:459 start_codon:yes stop_codon:yes gene_type:complete
MRYEVLNTYEPQPGGANFGIPAGTPLDVRIFPENTDVRKLFVSMVQSAYEMDGTPGLGGLATINEPDSISEKEAAKFIQYDSKRSLTDKILRRPDTRVPKEIRAKNIRGRKTELNVYQSEEVSEAYEMAAHVFAREVGSIDRLFALTQEKLE